jgi:hypothetical protein
MSLPKTMRPVVTTFVGVLSALLVYAGIRYAILEVKKSEIEKAAKVAEGDRMAIESERSKWAANWEWVQSAEDLLHKEGKYKAEMDFEAAHSGEKPFNFDVNLPPQDSDARYRALRQRAADAEKNLKTGDAQLHPLETPENLLWPSVLADHAKWRWDTVEKACGKAEHEASYNDKKQPQFGALDYVDAVGNLVHFEFGPNGVIVTYTNPKHVTNPDLIGSLNGMPCLSAVK